MTTQTLIRYPEPSAARVLERTARAEWVRLRTVRATWWFLAAAAVTMIGLGLIAGLEEGGTSSTEVESAWPAAAITTMAGQFALYGLVLLAVTADYSSRGIVPTLQWTPRRSALFAARTLVPAVFATGVGVLLAAAATVAVWLAVPRFTLEASEGLSALADVALVLGAGTLFTAGLGFALRSTAGGLVAMFLLMLVLPALLPQFGSAWMLDVAEAMPGFAAGVVLFDEVAGMSTTQAVWVLLGWTAAALVLGALRLQRGDADG